MSNEARDIQEAIQKLAGVFGLKMTNIISGEVKTIQEDDRTCSVTTVLATGTMEITGVNLSAEQNDGFIQIPAVDSTVIIAQMPDGENYVIGFSDIDKIICFIDSANKYEFDTTGFIWNGGTFGGLIKIDALKTQYDANLAAMKAASVAGFTAVDVVLNTLLPLSGVSTAAYTAAAASATALNKTLIENTKIKH